MHIITLASHKGGVAKTATAVQLAWRFATNGYKTCVIDLDPQADATAALGDNTDERSFLDIIDGAHLIEIVRAARGTGGMLDFIPSNLRFTVRKLAGYMDHLPDPSFDGLDLKVRDMLEESDYEIVIVDTPSTLDVHTEFGIVLADSVVIPVSPTSFAAKGIYSIRKMIDTLNGPYGARRQAPIGGWTTDARPTDTRLLGVLITISDSRPIKAQMTIEETREAFGPLVFTTIMRRAVALDEALELQRDVCEHDPSGNPAKDITNLYKEVISRVNE